MKPWLNNCKKVTVSLFGQKRQNLGRFRPIYFYFNNLNCHDAPQGFWSRRISETYGFTLVRTYVRTDFVRNPRIRFFCFFSSSSGSINAKKVTFSLFGREFKIGPFLAKNGPKLAIFGQNNPKSVYFAHIFKVTHQIFSDFSHVFFS